ncbi:Ran-binding protein 3 [Salmo salar]|uniref:Ran-binding protein 3 n=1 Tax=Salmo salar TaxID=8030 RepID=B9EMH8_SALSA|nr:Ran-binding protein 3 [Salmo salar]ACM08725.1 Ran-binding protein 3 [Salmo salar]|eukprot:NP_001139925.1 Ran-binding protein 3 [Salmo salar]
MADLANEEKPAIAPPVFVFQEDKAQKRSAEGSRGPGQREWVLIAPAPLHTLQSGPLQAPPRTPQSSISPMVRGHSGVPGRILCRCY